MQKTVLILIFVFLSLNSFGQDRGFERSGDILQIALPTVAFSSTLIWQDRQKGTLQFVKTMGTSVILTHSLKRIIDKPRPYGGRHGFPSGHTSSAFTGAAFLQKRYGWDVGILAYLLASYVGWSRIEANKHDHWDVMGGAIVCVGSAYLFTKPYLKPKIPLAFSVGSSAGFYKLHINYRFR